MDTANASHGKTTPTGRQLPGAGRDAVAEMIRRGREDGLDDAAVASRIMLMLAELKWVESPQLAKAMSHPVRKQILRILRDRGPSSPARAAEQMQPVSLGTVSYHFRTLNELGLIEIHSTRPRRGAIEHIYALSA